MKSLTLIFFTLSIVCIVIGYMELKIESKRQKNNFEIEYRFVPREIYDTQFQQLDIEKSFSDLLNNNLFT